MSKQIRVGTTISQELKDKIKKKCEEFGLKETEYLRHIIIKNIEK